jgi:hypothetical protein
MVSRDRATPAKPAREQRERHDGRDRRQTGGAAQTSFRIGGVGAPASTSDYFPLQVMNTILGRLVHSRLIRICARPRLSRTAQVPGFGLRARPVPFIASAEVVTAKTDSALIEFLKELRAIRDTVSSRRPRKGEEVPATRASEQLRDDSGDRVRVPAR